MQGSKNNDLVNYEFDSNQDVIFYPLLRQLQDLASSDPKEAKFAEHLLEQLLAELYGFKTPEVINYAKETFTDYADLKTILSLYTHMPEVISVAVKIVEALSRDCKESQESLIDKGFIPLLLNIFEQEPLAEETRSDACKALINMHQCPNFLESVTAQYQFIIPHLLALLDKLLESNVDIIVVEQLLNKISFVSDTELRLRALADKYNLELTIHSNLEGKTSSYDSAQSDLESSVDEELPSTQLLKRVKRGGLKLAQLSKSEVLTVPSSLEPRSIQLEKDTVNGDEIRSNLKRKATDEPLGIGSSLSGQKRLNLISPRSQSSQPVLRDITNREKAKKIAKDAPDFYANSSPFQKAHTGETTQPTQKKSCSFKLSAQNCGISSPSQKAHTYENTQPTQPNSCSLKILSQNYEISSPFGRANTNAKTQPTQLQSSGSRQLTQDCFLD